MQQHQESELINYTSAEEMASVYKQQVARIREAALVLGDSFHAIRAAFQPDLSYGFDIDIKYQSATYDADERGVEQLLHKLKLECWGRIISKLNIRRLMSSQRATELDKALAGGEGSEAFPDITPETIRNVVEGYAMSANEFLEEAVAEEYNWWRPWQGDRLKTNAQPWKLAKKVIKGYCVEPKYQGCWRATYHNEKHLIALANIFRMLDGKGPSPDYKGELCTAIEHAEDGTGESEYFKFKCFHNGNIHLQFKRQDLLDLFNSIAAKRDRLGQQNRGAA